MYKLSLFHNTHLPAVALITTAQNQQITEKFPITTSHTHTHPEIPLNIKWLIVKRKLLKLKQLIFLSIFLYYVLPDDGPFRPKHVASTNFSYECISTILVVIEGVLI
jgi:hypothetical protein